MARFDNKVVVVTGAANGIGHCMVERFLKEGVEELVAVDIEVDTLEDAFGGEERVHTIAWWTRLSRSTAVSTSS